MPSEFFHIHKVQGYPVRVYDTLSDFFAVRDALQDDFLDDQDRFHVLLALIFVDPQGVCNALDGDIQSFLAETIWDAFGIDIVGNKEHDDKRILDWDEDQQRMVVTSRTAYAMGWDDLSALPYKEACLLMMGAPHETPMGQAIYYRTQKPPKETKYNKDQVKAWKEAKKFYALKTRANTEQSMERANAAADAQFQAMAAAAKARKHG